MKSDTVIITVLFLFVASSPIFGQGEEPASNTSSISSRISAAGWCVINNGDEDDDGVGNESLDTSSIGCDIGIGLSLYRHRHLAWVGVLGSKSVGTGLAFIVNPDQSPVIAVAIGVITGFDERGIRQDVQLALGTTLSFRTSVGKD